MVDFLVFCLVAGLVVGPPLSIYLLVRGVGALLDPDDD